MTRYIWRMSKQETWDDDFAVSNSGGFLAWVDYSTGKPSLEARDSRISAHVILLASLTYPGKSK